MVLLVAIILTGAVYLCANCVQTSIVNKNYKSEQAERNNLNLAYENLEKFIATYNVKATDENALHNWLEEQDYTYLYVYDNYNVLFEGGWWIESNTDDGSADVVITDKKSEKNKSDVSGERITVDSYNLDEKNRIIQFADGEYYVYMDVYKEQHFYRIMALIKAILCMGTLLGTILIYNKRIINRIIRLSKKVQIISDGELRAEIKPSVNDEIGTLALNIDVMRDSIVEKLRNEKEAWEANTQLITAMSHDIRTPLTSLIGYLDIIEGGKYMSDEELKKYISSCRDKAFQLKDLSDKLFQYFLVFGSQEGEKNLEVYDAGILIQQLISEHTAELINYGFRIEFEYTVPDVNIKVELSGIRRLFDNVFSNIMKYGDRRCNVKISAVAEEDDIVVRLRNTTLESSRKVESNKIGLKTCEKICSDLGGEFIYNDEYNDDEKAFYVEIRLPVCEETVAEDEQVETEEEAE